MLFHDRRLSQDRLQRADLMRLCGKRSLKMSPFSAPLFSEYQSRICVEDNFLDGAERGELCWVENRELRPYIKALEGIVVYRWNRAYPADVHFDIALPGDDFALASTQEFPGSSHEKITREIYLRRATHGEKPEEN
jgi:hypothetical protein